jgi:Arc/MetJ-type ribon-helix-helix transcriptional regulator
MVITQKISINLPVAYVAMIDDLVDEENKYKSRTEFIIEAIKQELIRSGIDLKPKQEKQLSEWWDESDN